MTIRFLLIIFVSLSALAAPIAASAETAKLTIDAALERALTANRDIITAKERLAELEGIKNEARAQGMPQLTGTASYDRLWRKPQMFINNQAFTVGADNTYRATAEFNQLLWDGGRVIKAVKAAKTERAKGLQDVRDVESQIRLQVKQTYYQIIYTDNVIEVLKRQLKQLKDHLGSIQTRFKQGLDSDYTLMRQEVEVSNIEPDLINAEKTRELLINGLKILIAVAPDENIELTSPLSYRLRTLPDLEGVIEKARISRPDLNAQRLREKSLEHKVGAEKAGWWPSLNFNTTLMWQGQTDNWTVSSTERSDSLSSALKLTWPIFDGLLTHARVQQAKAQLLQQRHQNSQLEDSVVREAKDSLTSLEKAQAEYRSQQKSYELARKASMIAGERFEAGLMSQLELNDTINAQAKAEQLYLQAIYNCLSAEAELEKAIGGEM